MCLKFFIEKLAVKVVPFQVTHSQTTEIHFKFISCFITISLKAKPSR